MSVTVLGGRIPSPYYEWITGKKIGVPVYRRCSSCGHQWTNMEVPLFTKWNGRRATCCPEHVNSQSTLVSRVLPQRVEAGKGTSTGVIKVYRYGGVYRRRECSLVTCRGMEDGGRTRWSTGEFSSDGLIVRDVTVCSKCGGHGRERKGYRED